MIRLAKTHLTAEEESHQRILQAAQSLFAQNGFDRTTIKEIAQLAQVSEGTIFRQFLTKKNILVEIASNGWMELLTDLLTELSEMGSYHAVAQVMRKRMLHFRQNHDLLRVCFMEVQFHEDLKQQIQSEVVEKMMEVAEVFFETAIEKGIYRPLDAKIIARVFLGMFMIAGFSEQTIVSPQASPQSMKEMAEGIADIFLNGVLNPSYNY
ncbi:MAG: TetR/AcrR family transcriptional regulator [Prochlorotrichaceae cyanobacterium]|jgi:AcrR family transcriptional regulator